MIDGRKWGWVHILECSCQKPIVFSTSKYFTSKEIEAVGCRVACDEVPDVVIGASTKETSGYLEYLVVPNWENPRWLIPNQPLLIKKIGNFIKPSSITARLVWKLANFLNVFGGIGLLFRDRIYIKAGMLKGERNSAIPVLYTGAYGPYQKFTVQVMSLQGDILEFWKIGDHPAAIRKIIAEKDALESLKQINLKYNQVPEVKWETESENFFCIAMSPCLANDNMVKFKFSEHHLCSLLEIQKATLREIDFTELDIRLTKSFNNFDKIRHDQNFGIGELCKKLIRKIRGSGLSKVKICLSHGDYSPWNAFFSTSNAYVFDWELMGERPILWDLFNFVFHSDTLIYRRGAKAILRNFTQKEVSRFTKELLVSAGHQNSDIDIYIDLYLLEATFFYVEYVNELMLFSFEIDENVTRIFDNLKQLLSYRLSG